MTRGIAASGGLTAAVIAIVLAQGPAAASTAPTTTESSPTQSAGSGSPSAPQDLAAQSPAPQSPAPQYGQQNGDQTLQPPVVAPRRSHGGSSHALSGAT